VRNALLEAVEKKSLKEKLPYFEVGDTVDVHCKIAEGEKTRVQIFTGVVLARSGAGMNEHFTVRRIVEDEGVERTFPINSPNVIDVKPIRSGRTRRAKLYYLRKRTGKGVKLSQKRSDHTASA
jgi:large subunit ribosomal protein L19